jgi:glycosyltransferase involved in cell wall biosynthesis
MAIGRPVLASRLGGLPELVSAEETGLLVPPGDVDAWREALAAALADPERMRRLGEAGRRRAAREFGLERHVASVEALYREVAA